MRHSCERKLLIPLVEGHDRLSGESAASQYVFEETLGPTFVCYLTCNVQNLG